MSQVISSKDDWYVNIDDDDDDEQEEKEERKRASSSSPSPNHLQHMSATNVSKSKKSQQQQNSTVVVNKYASEDNVLITFKQKQVYTQDLDKEVSLFTWIYLWLAYIYIILTHDLIIFLSLSLSRNPFACLN
jgi:hypothetical protein